MRHPIQRLHINLTNSCLYTATSNVLHAFELSSGSLIAEWVAPTSTQPSASTSKKRKAHEGTASPTTIVTPSKPRKSLFAPPPEIETKNVISKILSTKTGEFIVAATQEDKAVRVLSRMLEVVSSRSLPKRIVDLALIENDSTILCADKFGDVFAFPLLLPTEDQKRPKINVDGKTVNTDPSVEPKPTHIGSPRSSSENLEGYTPEQVKRHYEKLASFEERERLAAERRKRTEIDYNLPFKHTFVLGHVSMLLSLITVKLPVTTPSGTTAKDKTWILTSDRDEHIRVTRFPQSFVIDGFCLGHESFVKAMITPSWHPTTLISGGGDDYILIWDWQQGRVLQRVDLIELVRNVIGFPSDPNALNEEFKMAVNGMWELPHIGGILIGIERVPALFLFNYDSARAEAAGLKFISALPLQGNVLDVAINTMFNTVYVSIDPESSNTSTASTPPPLLNIFQVPENGHWQPPEFQKFGEAVSEVVAQSVDVAPELIAAVRANVLYPVVNLRKDFRRDREKDEGSEKEF